MKQEKKDKKSKKRKHEEIADVTSSTSATPVSITPLALDPSPPPLTFHPADLPNQYPPVISFSDLSPMIDSNLYGKVSSLGFSKPTIVQSYVWRPILEGRDLVGVSKTGSGKTLAFGLPLISALLNNPSLLKSKNPLILILSPTRELALQITSSLIPISCSLRISTIYGGVPKPPQVAELKKGVQIVVGTPGRVVDLMEEGVLKLGGVRGVVLDEADRMLDKGFENEIRKIVGQCLPQRTASSDSLDSHRQTLLFSATFPSAIKSLANSFLHDPVRITVGSEDLQANSDISIRVDVLEDGREKEDKLVKVLREEGFGKRGAKKGETRDKCLVFALYKKEADRLERMLKQRGFEVGGIHGDMSQDKRTQSLDAFRSGQVELLVATDVAARGLDIPSVSLVINVTFPLTIEDFIHRIGRTGRSGKTGKSITFFTSYDKAHSGELVRVIRDAGQEIPEALMQFGTTIKKKTHSSYGSHFREDIQGTSKKIKFD